jgi:hypothetical protein
MAMVEDNVGLIKGMLQGRAGGDHASEKIRKIKKDSPEPPRLSSKTLPVRRAA